MHIRKLIVSLILILAFLGCKTSNNQTQELNTTKLYGKQPISYVNDYSDLLNEQEIAELDTFLRDYEKRTTRECILVVMENIEPYEDILEFGKDIGNRLGVGKKEKDNGLMIILDMSKRNVGISTGLGTEKVLTDSICQTVINEDIIPKFKDGKFHDGILAGFTSLMNKWK